MARSPAVSRVAVLVPVLGRPHRVATLLASLSAAVNDRGTARAFFLASPKLVDPDQHHALIASGATYLEMPFPAGPGDYARKMNHGFRYAVRHGYDWAFLAADDVRFHDGWIDHALDVHDRTGACVVGTNDTANAAVKAGVHSTHTFVHRDYLECGTADEAGKILHEGYGHQWVDNEFVETARRRGTYAHAHRAVVEHLHPVWGTADDDETYRKGQATADADRALHARRSRLWR